LLIRFGIASFYDMKANLILILSLLLSQFAQSQDAQWRGPERNGRFPETELLKKWPEGGPEMILKVEGLGMGYSSPVLHKGIIYITGSKNSEDYLSAVDLEGNVKYQTKYGSCWGNTYPEARSTPTVDNDRVYVISGMGEVACLNAEDGSIVWSVDANSQFHGEVHKWGIAESPLLIDNKVLYTCGGNEASVVALNKFTGKLEWKAKSLGGERTYVSPVIFHQKGDSLIVALTAHHVLGIVPENGEIIWYYEYLPPGGASARGATNNTNSPIIKGNEIFVSKGYDQYGVMLRVDSQNNTIKEIWRSSVMDTHHGHYVFEGDYIYGTNWITNSQGNWVCLDWKTGDVMYNEKWHTKGSIVFADGLLYCYEERGGNLALVRPTPKKFDIISSFKITDGTGPHWAHPYLADKKLLIRHGEVLMVFDISDKEG